MSLIEIKTEKAPKAIGPYSQAVKAGGFLFISGQLPLDPLSCQIIDSTIERQTTQVLENIEAILHSEKLSLQNVVKVEIYLKDLNDFAKVNALYAEKFTHLIKPARQTMQVARLPLDVLIEISAIAFYG